MQDVKVMGKPGDSFSPCPPPPPTHHVIILTLTNGLLIGQMETHTHDDVMKWKHFPRYWPFVRGIHRSPVNSPAQRPVTRSFSLFFELRLNKRLSKQSWDCWFETPSHPLWRHHNDTQQYFMLHGRCIIHFVVCNFALMLTCHIDCSYCWADWLTSTNSAECHLFQQYTVMHSETDMW